MIIDGALVECDCADGGSTSILTITATHPPTKHGLYCEAAYGGCTDKRFNDFMDTLSAAPLCHFCAGSFQTCGAGNDVSDGRHIIHIDRWRIRKDSFKPSWRLEAADDDDDDDDDAEDDDDEADGAAGKKSSSSKPSGFSFYDLVKRDGVSGEAAQPEDDQKISKLKEKLKMLKETHRQAESGAQHGRVSKKIKKAPADTLSSRIGEALKVVAEKESARRSKRKKKKHKKHKKKGKPSDRCSSSSSSSDSSSSSREEHFQGAWGRHHGSSLVSKVRKAPGRLTTMVLEKMQEFLTIRQGEGESNEVLAPMCQAYVTSVLLPSLGGEVGSRNSEELRTLAMAMDCIIKGQVAQGLDVLAGRFSAVETLATSKDWDLAKHLQVQPSQAVSCVNETLLDFAKRRAKDALKLKV